MQIEQHLRSFLENISIITGLDNYLLIDKNFAIKDYYLNDKKNKNADRFNTTKRWTFSSSVLFAFTILTTIGLFFYYNNLYIIIYFFLIYNTNKMILK